jgi:group I intron endonuclease
MKNFNFVYITTNLVNGKQYIGDHSSQFLDDNYLGSGIYFQRALIEYGKKNFKRDILEFFPTKKEAFEAQEKYINKYNTLSPIGYNISPKGGHGVSGCMSEETKDKFRHPRSQKIKEKIKNSLIGIKHTEERRKKISDGHKGNIPWNKGKTFTKII